MQNSTTSTPAPSTTTSTTTSSTTTTTSTSTTTPPSSLSPQVQATVQESPPAISPKLSKRIFHKWADKTRDKTKELWKKWRTTQTEIDVDLDKIYAETGNYKWSVHVWSAWVKRDLREDSINRGADIPGVEKLSSYQIKKFTFFFQNVMDMNRDGLVTVEDFVNLTEKLRHFADWSPNSIEYHELKEVNTFFFEALQDHATNMAPKRRSDSSPSEEEPRSISLSEWLDFWGDTLHGQKLLTQLPVWVQCLPRILFKLINRSETGRIKKSELKNFYACFSSVEDNNNLESLVEQAYMTMTCNKDFKLTSETYILCFSNFLFGRESHGPGGYVLGLDSSTDLVEKFPVDYSFMNVDDEKERHLSDDE